MGARSTASESHRTHDVFTDAQLCGIARSVANTRSERLPNWRYASGLSNPSECIGYPSKECNRVAKRFTSLSKRYVRQYSPIRFANDSRLMSFGTAFAHA
jgi:hypothetical protein